MEKPIKKKVDISIITVAYNSEDEIEKWVKSVVSTCKKYTIEMIISDNSPNRETEEIVKALQKKYPNLYYIYNNANLGFSRGNNVGIAKSKGEYVLFLNPDVVVEKGTIDGMMDFVKTHSNTGTATCAVFLESGELDDSCHRGFPTPWRSLCYFLRLSKIFPKSKILAGYNLTYMDFAKTHEIDSLAGSFMLVSRKLGEKLNWWDEDYFFYGEDIDFCYRIKKSGLKIYFVPEYKALHYKGLSSGIKKVSQKRSKASRDVKLWATNQRFNAMKIFYNKHYKTKYPRIVTVFVFLGINLKWNLSKVLQRI